MPLRTIGYSVVALIGMTSSAFADVITGEWCEPGGGARILVVKNYDDVTFVGKAVKANVDRHHVDFVIPAGEKDAGTRFDADQLSDEQIKVTIGADAAVIWTPCKPIS